MGKKENHMAGDTRSTASDHYAGAFESKKRKIGKIRKKSFEKYY